MNKPTVLSLFSGIGGFDLGLDRAGFDVVGQCEIDPFCNKVLARHWPGVTRYGDVRDISVFGRVGRLGDDHYAAAYLAGRGVYREDDPPSRLRGIDLIVGGFPCQDLSVAGKRAGREAGEDVAPTLDGRAGRSGETSFHTSGGLAVAHSLRAEGFDASADGPGRSTPLVVRTDNTKANRRNWSEDGVSYTLDQANGQHAAAAVRRLTPVECSRLQGFPDDWLCLCGAGMDLAACKCPDGPRYKALGNAVTVPVIEYLGRRIIEVLA